MDSQPTDDDKDKKDEKTDEKQVGGGTAEYPLPQGTAKQDGFAIVPKDSQVQTAEPEDITEVPPEIQDPDILQLMNEMEEMAREKAVLREEKEKANKEKADLEGQLSTLQKDKELVDQEKVQLQKDKEFAGQEKVLLLEAKTALEKEKTDLQAELQKQKDSFDQEKAQLQIQLQKEKELAEKFKSLMAETHSKYCANLAEGTGGFLREENLRLKEEMGGLKANLQFHREALAATQAKLREESGKGLFRRIFKR